MAVSLSVCLLVWLCINVKLYIGQCVSLPGFPGSPGRPGTPTSPLLPGSPADPYPTGPG